MSLARMTVSQYRDALQHAARCLQSAADQIEGADQDQSAFGDAPWWKDREELVAHVGEVHPSSIGLSADLPNVRWRWIIGEVPL